MFLFIANFDFDLKIGFFPVGSPVFRVHGYGNVQVHEYDIRNSCITVHNGEIIRNRMILRRGITHEDIVVSEGLKRAKKAGIPDT